MAVTGGTVSRRHTRAAPGSRSRWFLQVRRQRRHRAGKVHPQPDSADSPPGGAAPANNAAPQRPRLPGCPQPRAPAGPPSRAGQTPGSPGATRSSGRSALAWPISASAGRAAGAGGGTAMRPPEEVGGSAQRALRHLRGAGAVRAAADHLLKPAQGSSGRAGALGCGAAGPLPQTMGTAATRMQTRARPPAAAAPAAAPAHLPVAGPAAHAPWERACAQAGEAEAGTVPALCPAVPLVRVCG